MQGKNPAAVALGRLGAKAQPTAAKKKGGKARWAGLSAEERRRIAPQFASKGGTAAWAKLSPEERSAIMKARAAKRRKPSVPGADVIKP